MNIIKSLTTLSALLILGTNAPVKAEGDDIGKVSPAQVPQNTSLAPAADPANATEMSKPSATLPVASNTASTIKSDKTIKAEAKGTKFGQHKENKVAEKQAKTGGTK